MVTLSTPLVAVNVYDVGVIPLAVAVNVIDSLNLGVELLKEMDTEAPPPAPPPDGLVRIDGIAY